MRLFKNKTKGIHTVDGLINGGGGLKSGWAFIRNNIFFGKWMGLYPGGLKTGGLKVGFYGVSTRVLFLHKTSLVKVKFSNF